MYPNAIESALRFSEAYADYRAEALGRILYDVHQTPEPLLAALAADSDNILFDVTSTVAQEEANTTLGTREIWIAPFNAQGVAPADTFILLSKLRAGDTGPTPEAVTEDTTFDNGRVVSNQTGVNNGSKTWDVEGSSDEPGIDLLIQHTPLDTYGSPEKKGKTFAYIAFNADRSSFSGDARVNTASVPREGKQRWSFNIPYVAVRFRRPSQNPLAGGAGVPAAADVSPDSGEIGDTVTVTGVNLAAVDSVRLGSQSISSFATQTASSLSFLVPVGATAGTKTVTLVYDDDEVAAGTFEVTV